MPSTCKLRTTARACHTSSCLRKSGLPISFCVNGGGGGGGFGGGGGGARGGGGGGGGGGVGGDGVAIDIMLSSLAHCAGLVLLKRVFTLVAKTAKLKNQRSDFRPGGIGKRVNSYERINADATVNASRKTPQKSTLYYCVN